MIMIYTSWWWCWLDFRHSLLCWCLLLSLTEIELIFSSPSSSSSLARKLNLCKQTKLTNIMNLDHAVYIQFLDETWEYISGHSWIGLKDSNLRQLFYFELNPNDQSNN